MSKLKNDLIKYTPRKEQLDALQFIRTTYEKNPDNKFYLLNLPVGVGKSHLALMISDWYMAMDKSANVDVITAGKILQDQYVETYESINDLKGKENYHCDKYNTSCAQGIEFNRINKDSSCGSCNYESSLNGFLNGRISLTNFYLYLIHAIFNEKLFAIRKRDVLIVDECHELDQVICDFITIRIGENMIKRMGFSEQDYLLKELSKISNTKEYCDYLKYLNDEVTNMITLLDNELKSESNTSDSIKRDLKFKKILGKKDKKMDLIEKLSELKNLSSKFNIFIKEYENNPNNWVLESFYNEKTKTKDLSAEPIWAGDYLEKYVWSKYKYVFLMSGTILNKNMFSDLNGVDNESSIFYSIDSPFPVKNRLIYYMPIGKMSYAKKEETFRNYVPYLNKILKKYNDVKGIIHTNSFELSDWIKRDVSDKRLLFHGSEDRDKVLKKHMESVDPLVIVSPSVSTGVSFEQDLSRFQVIAKIPYPSLASKKNKLRQKNNPEWYQYVTVCRLIQMTGRSVRSKTDYADTLIIDESFSDILKWSSHYLPSWFTDAIKKVNIR